MPDAASGGYVNPELPEVSGQGQQTVGEARRRPGHRWRMCHLRGGPIDLVAGGIGIIFLVIRVIADAVITEVFYFSMQRSCRWRWCHSLEPTCRRW